MINDVAKNAKIFISRKFSDRQKLAPPLNLCQPFIFWNDGQISGYSLVFAPEINVKTFYRKSIC